MVASNGMEWRERDRRKLSFNVKKYPRRTCRSCGEFPGTGRTLPSRHFSLLAMRRMVITESLLVWGPRDPSVARVWAPVSTRSTYSSRYRDVWCDAWPVVWEERLSAGRRQHILLRVNSVPRAVPPASHPTVVPFARWL